jgi:hypothetical protein
MALFAALVAGGAFVLALPSGAGALVSGTSLSGGQLSVMGSPGPDQTEIRIKPDKNGQLIVQIYDPEGIPDPLPLGCTRKDPNTVVCPYSQVTGVDYHGGTSDDSIIFDFPVFGPPLAFLSATSSAGGLTTTMDGGDGNDTETYIGPGGGTNTEIGGPGNDTQTGGGGTDVLIGGPGSDHQSGQAGTDGLTGGAGNDKLKGGSGADKLNCGGGDDTGIGGKGKDKAKGCEEGKA